RSRDPREWGGGGRTLGIILNCDWRARPKPRQQTSEAVCRERHASRRRRSIGPRHVHEDRAATACHPGAGIVVDLDDEIVELVVAPEAGAPVPGGAPTPAGGAPGRGGCPPPRAA